MRTDSHDGELTLPLPRVRQASGAAAPRPPVSKRMVFGLLAALVALIGVSRIPAVQTVMRQSFSQLPSAYTELYFTSAPSVSGAALNVPITVNVHGAAAKPVTVKVWLVNAAGKTDAATSATLTPEHGTAARVVILQVPTDAEVVYASLVGQPQTLHYRIAGARFPAPAVER